MRDDCVNECLRIAQTVALECDLPSLSSTTSTLVRMSVNNDVRFYEVASYCWSHSSEMVSCVQEGSALIIWRFSECLLAKLLVLTSCVLMSLSLTVLKRLQFHRIVLSFILAGCFFVTFLTGVVIIYIKRTLFHFLARAWNYNKFNVSLWGYLLFCQ